MTSLDKKREIYGLFYFAAAVFLAVIFYVPAGRTGWLGGFVRSSGLGFFGTAALALPLVLLYMALDYFLESRISITRQRFTAVLLLWLSGAVLIAVFTTDKDSLRQQVAAASDSDAATKAISLLWQSGRDSYAAAGQFSWNGGLIGGLTAYGLRAVAGQTGAVIFTVAIILALLVLIFNLSFSKFIHQTANTINKTQGKVQEVVRNQVAEIKEHRDLRQRAPKVRRINNSEFDLPLPTAWQSPERDKKQGIYVPDNYDEIPDETDEDIYNLKNDDDSGFHNTYDSSEVSDIELNRVDFMEMPETDPLFVPSDENEQVQNMDQEDITDISDYVVLDDYEEESQPVFGFDSVASNSSKSENNSDYFENDDEDIPLSYHLEGSKPMQDRPLPYIPPSLDLLIDDKNQKKVQMHAGAIRALGRKLEQTLASFKVEAKVVNFTTGPTITRFELTPGAGVKVSRIVNLSDDIALNLAAMGVRIEAPIPGKAAIGIEIPNKETTPVLLRSLLESNEFKQAKSPLTAALGRDVQGNPIFCDLAKMPHLLIAGATGSGKSVCINCILVSLLYKASPEHVRLLMIDPKVVELSVYNGIPHLIQPVVTDPKKAYGVLNWAVNEMTRRYGLFADRSVRDIHSYNAALELDNEDESEKLPLILLVIDELSDLMATTPREVEDAIARLTAMARAAGMHLIIATQRPSVDVITGVIKANIPSRIAFSVASQIDSRTIIDMGGAEKLLGKGDMLYYPQSATKPQRGQGAFITDGEVEKILQTIKSQYDADYDEQVGEAIVAAVPQAKDKEKDKKDSSAPGEQDELLGQALGIVVETGYASVSLLQRRMTIGYPRAARLIDRLHETGYIGPFEGSKPRKVLISMAQYMELQQKEEEN